MDTGSKDDLCSQTATAWLQKHKDRFAAHKIRIVNAFERAGKHPVLYVNLETDSNIGRLCFWFPDTINAEVIRCRDGAPVLSIHRPITGLNDPALDEIMETFIEAMQ